MHKVFDGECSQLIVILLLALTVCIWRWVDNKLYVTRCAAEKPIFRKDFCNCLRDRDQDLALFCLLIALGCFLMGRGDILLDLQNVTHIRKSGCRKL